MEKKENRFQIISAIAAVVLLYLVLEGFGITCPIKFRVQDAECPERGWQFFIWILHGHFIFIPYFLRHRLYYLSFY